MSNKPESETVTESETGTVTQISKPEVLPPGPRSPFQLAAGEDAALLVHGNLRVLVSRVGKGEKSSIKIAPLRFDASPEAADMLMARAANGDAGAYRMVERCLMNARDFRALDKAFENGTIQAFSEARPLFHKHFKAVGGEPTRKVVSIVHGLPKLLK
jgi:hypothetical protein